jgi:hypothetical protein
MPCGNHWSDKATPRRQPITWSRVPKAQPHERRRDEQIDRAVATDEFPGWPTRAATDMACDRKATACPDTARQDRNSHKTSTRMQDEEDRWNAKLHRQL